MASLFELLGWIQWDDLEGLKSRESGVFEYSTSKLELIMAMRHLNRQLKVCSLLPRIICRDKQRVCEDCFVLQHFALHCWLWNGAFCHIFNAAPNFASQCCWMWPLGNWRRLLPLATGIGEDRAQRQKAGPPQAQCRWC